MDAAQPRVSSVGIRDGLIAVCGSDSEVLELRNPSTAVINAGGRCVIPGFNDSHMHMLNYATLTDGADLTAVRSLDDLHTALKTHIKKKDAAPGAEVRGWGFNQDYFDVKTIPNRHDLDLVSTAHPIYISRACGHVWVLNSMALTRAGITKETPDPAGGEILRRPGGEPTGVLTENAIQLAKANRKPLEKDAIKDLILSAAPDLQKMGITSIQTDDFGGILRPTDVCAAYTELAAEGKLGFRAAEQCHAHNMAELETILALPQPPGNLRSMFRLGPVKLLADGSLGARTALLRDGYADKPGTRGVSVYEYAELAALVKTAHASGRSLAVHAIGDGAIEMVLDSFEAAQKEYPGKNVRHGVVHAQITDRALLNRFKDLGVMAYVQPVFIHADSRIAPDRVGSLAATSYAFRTLRELGSRTPFGTDCPVESFNPFHNLYCAVSRKGLDGYPQGGFNINEALSVSGAVTAYTADGAYATFEEHIKGMIKPGYYADMVMLSRNIFNEETEAIKDTEAVMTVLGGRIVHSVL